MFRRSSASKAFQGPKSRKNGKKGSFSVSGGDLPHFRRFRLRKAGKQEDLRGNEGFRRSSASKAFQGPKSRKTGRKEASPFQAGIFRILGVSGSEKQENRKIFGKTKGFRRSSASKAFQAPKSRKTGRNEASPFQAGIFRILGVSGSEKQENRRSSGKRKVPEIFSASKAFQAPKSNENGKKRSFSVSGGDLPHFRRFRLRKAGKQEDLRENERFWRSSASKAFQASKSMKTGRNEASPFQAGIFRILGVSGSEKQENRKIFGKTKGSGDLPHFKRFKLRKA